MQTSKQIADGSGRITIVETDDRGEPEASGTGQLANFAQVGTFQELISIPLNREQQAGKGSARLGMFLFSANVNPGLSGADYVLLDCFVTGYVGGAGTVIKRMAFGTQGTDDFLRLDDSNNYDRIGVSGRQMVNGSPDSATVIGSLTLNVVGRVSR